MSKMKILIPMFGFFPGRKYGGPPVSIDNFCTLFDEYETYIVATNHDIDSKEPYSNIEKGWNNRENCKVLYLSDREYCYSSFKMIIKEISPDYIYLQSLFQTNVIPFLLLSRIYNIKVLLAPRGELCAGAFDKKYKKKPYITLLKATKLLKNTSYQSTSEEETEAILKYLGTTKDKVYFLTNLPSIPKHKYKKTIKVEGSANLIFLSRIVPKKNLNNAIKYLQNVKGNVVFDIYGPLEDENYWSTCLTTIKLLPDNVKVHYMGLVNHDMVHETFSKYDALLLPTFSENYGHVIAEALLSGCSVITSDQTPWSDMNTYNCGFAIPLSEPENFTNALQQIIDMTEEESMILQENIAKYLHNKLKLEAIKRNYKLAFEH